MALKGIATVRLDNIDGGLTDQFGNVLAYVDKILSDTALVVRDDAKNSTAFKDKTGNLRKSIRKRKSKFINGGYIVVATGRHVSGGEKGFHAHLVEYGHAKVLWGRRTGGRVPPHPFMRPAVQKGVTYLASRIGK
jgi:HK97 gp10 family phage protein